MTYLGVLIGFVLPPALLTLLLWARLAAGRRSEAADRCDPPEGILNFQKGWLAVFLLAFVAVTYTTPWDNYLVANGVWWYDPSLVLGITLGWVPLEEYAFFILQSLMTGFFTLLLLYRRRMSPLARPSVALRGVVTGMVLTLWGLAVLVLIAGWMPGTYLALILVWALPAVALQLAFGADILFARWRTYLSVFGIPTIYLWLVDYLAIASGTWMIDPARTTGILAGVLPVEEMVFFLVTNVLVAGGVILIVSTESRRRARHSIARLSGHLNRAGSGLEVNP